MNHPSSAIEYLRARGLSDYGIGQLAGIPQSTVFRIRTGQTPSPRWDTSAALIGAAEAEGFGQSRRRRRVNAAR